MESRLAERFQASRGAPVEWHGRLVHMMYELQQLSAPSAVRIGFWDTSTTRPQALRLKARGGGLEVNGEVLDDIVLWSDSAPGEVIATVRPHSSGKPMSLRVWNAWRDAAGSMQAWIGDAGMLIEETPGGTVVLRCSDGFDEPDFNDLVTEIQVVLA